MSVTNLRTVGLAAIVFFAFLGLWMIAGQSLREIPYVNDLPASAPRDDRQPAENLRHSGDVPEVGTADPRTRLPDVEDLKARARRGEWSAFLAASEADQRCAYFWMGDDFARVNLPPPPPPSPVSVVWQNVWSREKSLCASKSFAHKIAPYTTIIRAEWKKSDRATGADFGRLLFAEGLDQIPLSDFLDEAEKSAKSADEQKALLLAAFSGSGSRILELPGASVVLSSHRFRPERRAELARYAAQLAACQRGAACPIDGALQVGACLREYNCAAGLPTDRFIRERLLLPGERETVESLALLIEGELRRRGI